MDGEQDEKPFPYRVLNDMCNKLKAAEAQIMQEREYYETKILSITYDYEVKLEDCRRQTQLASRDEYELEQLKQKVSSLVYENNRYHIPISNCTVCVPGDDDSDVISSLDLSSIGSSNQLPHDLPSSEPALDVTQAHSTMFSTLPSDRLLCPRGLA